MAALRSFWRIGLTGGIGSGKSTVAGLLAQRGAAVIDADAISRGLTQSGGEAIEPIRQLFGTHVINGAGALDRDAMRALVFSQPQARGQLEAIIHPLVGQAMAREVAAATQAGARVVVLDIPLLVESRRWPAELDRVVVVDCLPDTQVNRVAQRSGLSPDAVRAIMAAQASRSQRLAAADVVLYNEGLDLAALASQVERLAAYFGL